MDKWEPIETAPKDSTSILATGWDDNEPGTMRHYVVVLYDESAGGFISEEDNLTTYTFLTHWMPLPEPPND